MGGGVRSNYGCCMPTTAGSHPVRWTLSVLCTLAAIVLATATVALSWFSSTIVDKGHFGDAAADVVTDQNFRDELSNHVTDDVMASDTVKGFLGDGSASGLLSGPKNALRATAQGVVHSAVSNTVNSDEFRSVWADTADATHDANFGSSPSSTLVLDASPFYDEINNRVHDVLHVDLGLNQGDHRVALEQKTNDQGEGETASLLHKAQHMTSAAPVLGTLAGLLALAAGVIAPRGKLLMVAMASAGAALLTWASMSLLGSRFNDSLADVAGTGGLISQHLGRALTENIQPWTLTTLGIGLGLAVILVILQVLTGPRGDTKQVF